MSRIRWQVLAVVLAAAVVGVIGVLWWKSFFAPTYDLTRHDQPADLRRAWPLNNFWTWTAKVPQPITDRHLFNVQIRSKSVPRKKGVSPARSLTGGPISSTESEASDSTASLTLHPDSAGADRPLEMSVQLIDTSVLQSSATRPATQHRVLATLAHGGAQTYLGRGEVLPLTGRVAGWAVETDKNWKNDALLLMRFWTEEEGLDRQFDVVLVRQLRAD